ncbi:hypothetical protein RvY_02366 [Ramazzottius varieornatus]|uniref:Uncharacterized protein n=1 Tax=Ramazzottius varieornatus TaxID=947166 RepID=A0A1D1UJI3_RAMVA|nr:hypothetical protein RvY_02366 [Ramazzottius varieornatus]
MDASTTDNRQNLLTSDTLISMFSKATIITAPKHALGSCSKNLPNSSSADSMMDAETRLTICVAPPKAGKVSLGWTWIPLRMNKYLPHFDGKSDRHCQLHSELYWDARGFISIWGLQGGIQSGFASGVSTVSKN